MVVEFQAAAVEMPIQKIQDLEQAPHVSFLGLCEKLLETGGERLPFQGDCRQVYLDLGVRRTVGYLPLLRARFHVRNFPLQRGKAFPHLLQARLRVFVPHLFDKRAQVRVQFRASNFEHCLFLLNLGIVALGFFESPAHLPQALTGIAIVFQLRLEILPLRL